MKETKRVGFTGSNKLKSYNNEVPGIGGIYVARKNS